MSHFADVHAQARFAAEKMKKNNLFTTDRLFCDVYCFEPGQEQQAHSHAGSDKVYYVLSGTAVHPHRRRGARGRGRNGGARPGRGAACRPQSRPRPPHAARADGAEAG